MLDSSDGTFLRRETPHPGMFALPLVAILLSLAAAMPLLWFIGAFARLFHGTGAFALMVFAPEVLLALGLVAAAIVTYSSSEIVLTTRKLKFRTGFLARVAGEIGLESVEGLFIFESLLGRLFGFGTVTVTTVGGRQWKLPFIGRPQVFHALVQKAVASAKAGKEADAERRGSDFEVSLQLGAGGSRFLAPVLAVAITVLLFAGVGALMPPLLRTPAQTSVAGPFPIAAPIPQVTVPRVSVPMPLPALLQPAPQGNDLATIKAAAESGDPIAADKLGDTYWGRLDAENAVRWYRMAAANGIANSQYHLGNILLSWANSPVAKAEVRAQHADEGLLWLIKAANQGVKQAQVDLGMVYREGKFVTRDYSEAYKWFSVAAAGAGQLNLAANLGSLYRDQLMLQMSQAQIAEGNRRAATFAPNSGEDVTMPEPVYVREIKLAGLGGVAPRRFAIINGKTLAPGESATVKVAAREVAVRCVSIGERSAVVAIGDIPGTRELVLK